MEEAVLGGILLEPEHLRMVDFLKPDYFYKEQNSLVFKAILSVEAKSNEKIDLLTVIQELKSSGDLELVGGSYYISSLTNKLVPTANIEVHARHIHEKFLLRELIRLATNIVGKAYEGAADPFVIIDEINKCTAELTNIITNKIQDVGQIFNEMCTEIRQVQDEGLPTGLHCGMANIDDHTGGWQRGTLNILAARPGMGKTALSLAIAKYPAMVLKKPVAIFSIEMRAKQLVGRLAASESNISSSRINQKSINRHELQTMGARCFKLIEAPIYIDDTPNISFSDFRSKARKLFYDHKIELIIVDYLQLMTADDTGNREQEISYISRNLKAMSRELDIPIIALSQLSRQVENRTGKDSKRPQLSDLRESGSIEQDADNVMFIFRPEYYGLYAEGYPYEGETLPARNLMLVEFAKGRELKLGEVPLKFYGEFMICDNFDLKGPELPLSPLENNIDF
jgi:replicative DNA helicase